MTPDKGDAVIDAVAAARSAAVPPASPTRPGRILPPGAGESQASGCKPFTPGNGRTIVRVAYLTTDEVNRELALQLAAGLGVDLCVLSPGEPAGPESFAGVLYDLDYLPESRRQEILADLLAGPVAVHGYNLDADQEGVLCENGVLVSRASKRSCSCG
jgi:hypothetical protein